MKTSHRLRIFAMVGIACGIFTAQAQMTPPVLLASGKIDKTQGVGITQQLGSQVPGNLTFTDADGKVIQLSQLYGKRPILLNLMYYNCKATCTLITEGLLDSFAKMRLSKSAHDIVGQDVDVVTISINPLEKPADAQKDRREVLSVLDYPSAKNGWQFLTGTMPNIQKLVTSVGFHYTFDKERNLVNHPAAIILLTPEGKVSQYFFGSAYPEIPLHNAITLASDNQLGDKKPMILLGCFSIDPATGKYTADVDQVLKVFGTSFAILFGIAIIVMIRQKPKYELVARYREHLKEDDK